MAKVHDKYVVELAEIIKGYGNDPDINDPFCLSTFYRFYEVPNVCVSAENLKKMRPLSDYTEEIEPGSISEWKKEFREYVDSLDIARDDWKGIAEYIDELPSAEPDTTTHDSIPVETGKNDGDKTSGDCISRQAVTKFLNDWLSCLFENCHKQSASDLKMIIKDFKNLPSAQPETNCSEIPNNCPAADVVPVVRCKDCKHWNPQFKTANGNGLGSCDFHNVALVTSEGFCYWAEKRGGNDEKQHL